ncbi:MAG TPA: glycosyltransferase [Actinomycetes bacterium]|nr:glycosyltransferase [Actinomycetes bacterium]
MTDAAGPLLLVTVGTDHHPFDRLVSWAAAWLDGHPGQLRCLMQTGTSAPPTTGAADWRAYLEFDALQAAMAEAAAVVCHGGPGTILGARHMGAVPIVVPRQHRLGEHVDDHQVAFSRRLAAEGDEIHLAEGEADLHRLLDRVAAEPAIFRAGPGDRATAVAVREFGRLVDGLVGERPGPAGAGLR